MTEEEKTLLINEIVDYLISHSQSVEGILEATDLDGVSSLPAIKEILNEVENGTLEIDEKYQEYLDIFHQIF